eukprot:gene24414-32863_t
MSSSMLAQALLDYGSDSDENIADPLPIKNSASSESDKIMHEDENSSTTENVLLESISENTLAIVESTPPPEIPDDTKSNPLRFVNEIPSPVKVKVNQYLIDTINSQLEAKRKQGFDLTEKIRSNKDFHNPYILKKVVEFFAIDEIGSNYPKEVFDPHSYAEEDFEESIRRRNSTPKPSVATAPTGAGLGGQQLSMMASAAGMPSGLLQNQQLSQAILALQQRGIPIGSMPPTLIQKPPPQDNEMERKRNRWA